jgi:hypothetical protein
MIDFFKRIISFKSAVWTVIILSCMTIIFHILILLRIIPYENVWAGRLKRVDEMYIYESISIAVNCILIVIVLIKIRMINAGIFHTFINILLWIFVLLFILNTAGNLTSKTTLETIIATPLTFVLALLCLRIVAENHVNNNHLRKK